MLQRHDTCAWRWGKPNTGVVRNEHPAPVGRAGVTIQRCGGTAAVGRCSARPALATSQSRRQQVAHTGRATPPTVGSRCPACALRPHPQTTTSMPTPTILPSAALASPGLWPLGSGLWPWSSGLWPLDSGLWPLGSGHWPLGSWLERLTRLGCRRTPMVAHDNRVREGDANGRQNGEAAASPPVQPPLFSS